MFTDNYEHIHKKKSGPRNQEIFFFQKSILSWVKAISVILWCTKIYILEGIGRNTMYLSKLMRFDVFTGKMK